MTRWATAQNWEHSWWGDCTNTLGEEIKQTLYAERMGLQFFNDAKSPYNIDLQRKDVVDIGGGPSSLLLRCYHRGSKCAVVDPLKPPDWVLARYALAGIEFINMRGEEIMRTGFDEAWIYNCLQHVDSPEYVLAGAARAARIIRIFEWIDTPTNVGHLHSFTERKLNALLGGLGRVERVATRGCYGTCYYGIFPSANVPINLGGSDES